MIICQLYPMSITIMANWLTKEGNLWYHYYQNIPKRKGVLNSLIFQPLIHSLTDAPTYTAFFSQTVFFDAFHLLWIEADGLLDSLLAIRFLWSCHTTTSALFIIMVVGNSSKMFWWLIVLACGKCMFCILTNVCSVFLVMLNEMIYNFSTSFEGGTITWQRIKGNRAHLQ